MRAAPEIFTVGAVVTPSAEVAAPLSHVDLNVQNFKSALVAQISTYLYLRNQSFLPGERGEGLSTVEQRVTEVRDQIVAQMRLALSDVGMAQYVENAANAAFIDAVNSFPMPDLPLQRYYHHLIESALKPVHSPSQLTDQSQPLNTPHLRLVQ